VVALGRSCSESLNARELAGGAALAKVRNSVAPS
jgi:hypothetical protein